jgi:hypothetical protein
MNILEFDFYTFSGLIKELNLAIKNSFEKDNIWLNTIKVILMINPYFTGIYYVYIGILLIWILSLALKLFKTPVDIALKLVRYVNKEISDFDHVSKFLINAITYLLMSYVLIIGLTGLVVVSSIIFLLGWAFNLIISLDLLTIKQILNLDVNYEHNLKDEKEME